MELFRYIQYATKWFLLLSKMKDEYLNNGYHVFKVFLDETVNIFYDNY